MGSSATYRRLLGYSASRSEIGSGCTLGPNSDVEFHVEHGSIILTKAPKRLELDKWKGHCSGSLGDLGYPSVDDFIEDVRGR